MSKEQITPEEKTLYNKIYGRLTKVDVEEFNDFVTEGSLTGELWQALKEISTYGLSTPVTDEPNFVVVKSIYGYLSIWKKESLEKYLAECKEYDEPVEYSEVIRFESKGQTEIRQRSVKIPEAVTDEQLQKEAREVVDKNFSEEMLIADIVKLVKKHSVTPVLSELQELREENENLKTRINFWMKETEELEKYAEQQEQQLPVLSEQEIKEEAEKLYNDLDEFARDVDSYDFGLPMTRKEKGIELIIAALTAHPKQHTEK